MKLRAAIEELKPFADRPAELAEQLKTRAPELAQILRGVLGPNAVLNRFAWETIALLSDQAIADASVMPYDEQRFKFLRGIVERC